MNSEQMAERITSRYQPDHDYEAGDLDEDRHPMHSDPLCKVCGRAATSYRHN